MTRRKKQAEENLESSKEHVKSEKAKLDKYLEERTIETTKEIASIDTTTEWLEELK